MQPRIPRPPLNQTQGANVALIAITWSLVAVDVFGLGFMGFTMFASTPFELGYNVTGVVLICSRNRTNKINGWIVVCYGLFHFLLGMGRALSRYG
jgi:hypothetical protein